MISPETIERNRDGALRYMTTLSGTLDGCRLEVLYLPHNEMISSLVDEVSGENIESMKLLIGTRESGRGEKSKLMKIIRPQHAGVQLVWDDKANVAVEHTDPDLQEELIKLSAWWLAETQDLPVSIDDRATYDPETIKLIAAELVADSKMEAFYGAQEVSIEGNLLLQTHFDPSLKNGWLLEMAVHDGKEYLGWIDGSILILDNDEMRFTIGTWKGDWDKLRDDLLAIALRFLRTRIGQITVMYKEDSLEMGEEEMGKKSSFWLGF